MKGKRYCTNCGQESSKKHCLQCGVKRNKTHHYCQWCGAQLGDNATLCTHCMEPISSQKWAHFILTPIKYILILFAFMNIVDGYWGYALGYLLGIYCCSKLAYKHIMFLTLNRPSVRKTLKIMRIFSVVLVLLLCGLHVPCAHKWEDASCSAPKTCSLCGETEGKILQHQWEEATCASAKKCALCNLTEGASLEHTWKEATCKAPKTCSVCGTTTGTKLEHTYTEWEIDIEATVSTPGKRVRYCSTCQSTDSESYQLKTFIEEKQFIFTPEEFRKRFFDTFVDLGYSKFGGAQVKEKEGQVMVSIIDSGYNNVGNIGFVADKNTWRMATSKTESGFDGIIMIISAHEEFIANAIIAVIMSTNPTITEYGAREVAKSVLTEETSWAGITYTFAVTGNYYTMTAIPTE